MQEHTVVVIGAGFGGLQVARALCGAPCRVLLVDRQNHHLFQPLLYQVATGGLSAADICAPIRSLVARCRNVEVLMEAVQEIDLDGRMVRGASGLELNYDTLVVAAGMRNHYFGHPEWERFAPGLKEIRDATQMRQRVFTAFEMAERETGPAARQAWLRFVVVGGGPTGVELAGALAEIARDTLRRDFRRIRTEESQILLLDAAPRVLGSFARNLSDYAVRRLIAMGVRPLLEHKVLAIDDEGVTAEHGGEAKRIPARTVLWAAGVAASPLGAQLSGNLDRAGRVPVAGDLSLPGRPEVFVIGDLARVEQDGQPLPGVAQPAIQQGRYVGRVIARRLNKQPAPPPFRYLDLGNMATIGRHSAVAELFGLRFTGHLAWLVWLFIHLMHLVGFQNRLVVLIRWAINYLTFNRGARLITRAEPEA